MLVLNLLVILLCAYRITHENIYKNDYNFRNCLGSLTYLWLIFSVCIVNHLNSFIVFQYTIGTCMLIYIQDRNTKKKQINIYVSLLLVQNIVMWFSFVWQILRMVYSRYIYNRYWCNICITVLTNCTMNSGVQCYYLNKSYSKCYSIHNLK